MSVLPAVFPDAGDVSLDIAGIFPAEVEGRGEQEAELDVAAEEMGADGVHRPVGARGRSGARQDGPGLGDGVDAAFFIEGRTEGRAVVVVAATIPVAVPRELQAVGE